MRFYEKVGFEEIKRVPLRRVVKADMVVWEEDATLAQSDASLDYMLLGRSVRIGDEATKPVCP